MIVTFLIGKIIFDGYWLVFAPALFLPLGIVLLNSQARRGTFGYVVLLLALAFAVLGVIFLLTLTLADAVTALAGILSIWCLAATITLVARRENKVVGRLRNTHVLGDLFGTNF
jgi:cytochrome c biogenesis factor